MTPCVALTLLALLAPAPAVDVPAPDAPPLPEAVVDVPAPDAAPTREAPPPDEAEVAPGIEPLAVPSGASPTATPVTDPTPPVAEATGPVAISTAVSPDPAQVGDLIKLEVVATYPPGYTVNLPIGLRFAPLHLVTIDESEPTADGPNLRKVFTITLQHFAIGEAEVPGFPLTYLDPNGEVQTVKVSPTPFTTSSLLANEPDPKRQGEDPPVSIPYPNRQAELIVYSAAGALLIGLVVGLLWARWRRRPRPVVLPPPEPAHIVAYRQLDELQQAELVARGAYQDYYLQLTEIAKAYLEGRFGIDALDRTTDELRRDLERAADQLAPLKPPELIRFLQACDLVKFARFAPPADEADAALQEVRSMVTVTSPNTPTTPPADTTATPPTSPPPQEQQPPEAHA